MQLSKCCRDTIIEYLSKIAFRTVITNANIRIISSKKSKQTCFNMKTYSEHDVDARRSLIRISTSTNNRDVTGLYDCECNQRCVVTFTDCVYVNERDLRNLSLSERLNVLQPLHDAIILQSNDVNKCTSIHVVSSNTYLSNTRQLLEFMFHLKRYVRCTIASHTSSTCFGVHCVRDYVVARYASSRFDASVSVTRIMFDALGVTFRLALLGSWIGGSKIRRTCTRFLLGCKKGDTTLTHHGDPWLTVVVAASGVSKRTRNDIANNGVVVSVDANNDPRILIPNRYRNVTLRYLNKVWIFVVRARSVTKTHKHTSGYTLTLPRVIDVRKVAMANLDTSDCIDSVSSLEHWYYRCNKQ